MANENNKTDDCGDEESSVSIRDAVIKARKTPATEKAFIIGDPVAGAPADTEDKEDKH